MKRTFVTASSAIVLSFIIVCSGFAQQKAASENPQYGGVLRQIASSGPRMLGYPPLMGPFDQSAIFPAGERLVDVNADRQIEPVLAEKVRLAKDLAASAYAVYLLHVPVVVSLQYAVGHEAWGPLVKFFLVTLIAVPATFALGSGLRRLPLARSVL